MMRLLYAAAVSPKPTKEKVGRGEFLNHWTISLAFISDNYLTLAISKLRR